MEVKFAFKPVFPFYTCTPPVRYVNVQKREEKQSLGDKTEEVDLTFRCWLFPLFIFNSGWEGEALLTLESR